MSTGLFLAQTTGYSCQTFTVKAFEKANARFQINLPKRSSGYKSGFLQKFNLICSVMRKSGWIIGLILLVDSCTSYKYSNKSIDESVILSTIHFDEALTLKQVVNMNNPESEASRGLISTDLLIQGANLAIQGVGHLIKESQKSYTAEYFGGLNNENFYTANSVNGMMDPEGIQFKGFVFERIFKEKKSQPEVAVRAWFSIDQSKLHDIYFNSKFYLKLDSVSVKYAKVKINEKKWFLPWTLFLKTSKTFNLDFEIRVLANWIDQSGLIHQNILFGKFLLPLRNIPIDPGKRETITYFENLKNTPLSGSSYIIPRSVTYCTDKRGEVYQCFGRGVFDIQVKVRESSKEGTVAKLIHDNSEDALKNLNTKDLKKILK
jgi:hypothetical protein